MGITKNQMVLLYLKVKPCLKALIQVTNLGMNTYMAGLNEKAMIKVL